MSIEVDGALKMRVELDSNDIEKEFKKALEGVRAQNDKFWKEVRDTGQNNKVASPQTVNNSAALKDAQVKLKEAQLANIEALRQYRLEQIKQEQDLSDLNARYKQGQIDAQQFRLEQAKLTAEQKEQAKAARELKKELANNSEYAKLSKALNNVRRESKDVLAEMFRLEKQGGKTSIAYAQLEAKSKDLVKQTNYLDNGVKRIDATVGQHGRNVGHYTQVLEGMIPIISRVNSQLATFGVSIDDLANKPGAIKELGTSFVSIGKGIAKVLLSPLGVLATALGSLVLLFVKNKQAVIDFNNGLLDVAKTTGLEGKGLKNLSDDIIRLSQSLQTVSSVKLLEYASDAGQLGVKGSKNILAFTEALAKLQTASDISGEGGGAEIARLLTLTDGGVQNVKAFGDEIVNLGNNFAATEKEILSNATKIAQSTGVYKVGRQEVLAFATATKSVGVEAELVGSTMGRTLGTLEKTIRSGNGLSTVLKLVGGTQAELSKRFRDDAAGVLVDFISGLNRTGKSAADFNKSLEEVGITAIRDQAVLGSLASNGFKILTDALGSVKDATGAMDDEFNTASQKLVNQTARIGIAWDNMILRIENGQGAIGKASVAVIGFVADTIDTMSGSVTQTDRLVSSYERFENQTNKLDRALKPLLERYDQLKSKSNLNKVEQEELKSTIQQLADLIPTAVTGFKEYGEVIDINRGKIISFNNAQKQLLKDMNLSTVKSLNTDLDELKRQRDQLVKMQNISVSGNETLLSKFFSIGLSQNDKTNGLVDRTERLAKTTDKILQNLRKTKSLGGILSAKDEKLLERYDGIETSTTKKNNAVATEVIKKNKAYWEGIVNETQAVIENLEIGQKGTKKWTDLTNKLAEAQKQVDKYSLSKDTSTNKSAGRLVEYQRKATERQRSLQLEIDKINENASRNQLSRDQSEVDSVKDKYAKIREEVRKFYDDPKNKGQKVDTSGLLVSENFEISEAVVRLDTKRLEESLDAQKRLFDEFNTLSEQTSKESAEKRFGNELAAFKSYEENVEKAYWDLLTKKKTADAQGFNSTLKFTRAEEEQLKALEVRRTDIAEKRRAKDTANYILALNAAKTHTQKLEDIEKEYQQNIKSLGTKASIEQLAELKKSRDEKLKSENEEFFIKSDLYKQAAKAALVRTRQEIKDQIKVVEELLKTDLAPNIKDRLRKELNGLKINLSIGSVKTNISNLEKQRQDISNALSEYNSLNGISAITDQALESHPELKKLYDQLNEITLQLVKLKKETNDGPGGGFLGFLKKLEGNETLKQISEWGDVAAQSFNQMSQALGGSETQAGYLLGTIGELAGAAADVAGAIASGDPKAIVKSVVGAVGSIISISKRTKEMNRQARADNQKFYDEAIKGEKDYQALLRQRERESALRGKNSYNAIISQLEAIKKQSPEVQAAYDKIYSSLQGQEYIDGKGYKHGTWFRKAKAWDIMASLGGSDYNELEKLYSQGKLKDQAKTDFEALKALREELEETGLSLQDLQNDLNQLLTGTSNSSLASGLADLFANGKRSAQDFGDSFESIMQNAIKSSFQAKYLEDAMQPFYEELAKMMEGGDLTSDQIQKLKEKYAALGEEYAKKWEDIEKVTGVDLSSKDKGSTGSLKNDIQAVTESTAGRLEAEFGGFRIAQLQTLAEVRSHGLTLSKQLEIANSNLVILNAIQVNTYRTAGNTDRLENIENALVSINNKVSSSDAARRGAGL